MSFTIYTAGDASFLEEVLNSVAMVSGSGAIASVAAVGALVTVIILGFRSIMEGGKWIRFEELLLGFIIYMISFYPTTTALIEDGYSGNVHVVDNVPLGPVVAGWAVSSIGYKLTKIFETGYRFTSHGSADSLHRFAEPLEMLIMLRSSSTNPALMSSVNINLGPYADIRRSWENYFKECTLVKVDLGVTTANKLITSDFREQIRFDSDIYGTRLFLGPQGGQDFTCADAYDHLQAAMLSGMQPNSHYDQVLYGMLTRGTETDQWGAAQSAYAKLEGATSEMLGVGTDIQKYMEATILQPVFEDAVEGKYIDMLDTAAAVAFRQSLVQRNTQWAQEQSAFMTVIRPAMTFFEGFVYAVTPMLAMLFVMGRFGISLTGKYLQVVFWVQLWLPILSICNLYIRNAADKQIKSLAPTIEAQEALFSSVYGINSVPEIMESWLAVGSMLAASTPMLAFFLVSGSSYAFTNIAGRLGGQDHFDEKAVTPDATKVGAATNVAAGMNMSRGGGQTASGSEGYIPSVSVSDIYQNATQSSAANYSEAQKGFTNSFQKAFQSSVSEGQQYQTIKSLADNGAFSVQKTSGYNQSDVDSIAKKHGVSADTVKSHMAYAQAAITAGLGVKTPGGGLSLGASMEAGMRDEAKVSDSSSYTKDITSMAQSSLQSGTGTTIIDQLADSFTESGAQTFMSGITASQAETLNESASNVQGTRLQHSVTTNNTEGLQNTRQYKYNEIGSLVHNAGQGANLAAIIGNDRQMQETANNYAGMYESDAFGMSQNTARPAAMFAAIMDNGTVEQKVAAANLLTGLTAGDNTRVAGEEGSVFSQAGDYQAAPTPQTPTPTRVAGNDSSVLNQGGDYQAPAPTQGQSKQLSLPMADTSSLAGVDPSSVTPTSVRGVQDRSGTEVGQINPDRSTYEGKFQQGKEDNIEQKNQDFALSNAREQLSESHENGPELFKDHMSAIPTLSGWAQNLAQEVVVGPMVAAKIIQNTPPGQMPTNAEVDSYKRASYLEANQGSGATQDFITAMAPHLTSGQQAYLQEVRLGGDIASYKEAAYSQMRDEMGIRDEHGQIVRNADGQARLNDADERDLAQITEILDRNRTTNVGSAKQEAMSIGQYNAARFNLK